MKPTSREYENGSAERPFWVLLGPDYAGKSSVLFELSGRAGWSIVSYDKELVSAEFGLIDRLREEFLHSALQGVDRVYSRDFVISLLQASAVHLRDQALRAPRGQYVLVDSYYYKILAKCVLAGYVNEHMFAFWRSFPRPEGVVFLDVDPSTAWSRSGEGAAVNALECYSGDHPRAGFERFQKDLRRSLMHEVRDLPVHMVSRSDSVRDAAAEVEHIIRRKSEQRPVAGAADRAVSAPRSR